MSTPISIQISASKINTKPQALRQHLHFGQNKPDATNTTPSDSKVTFEKEITRLTKANQPGLFQARHFTLQQKTLEARARFNVTQEPNLLHPFLPYRELLVKTSQKDALKTYDQLVEKILGQAEFHEVASPNPIKSKIQEASLPPQLKGWLGKSVLFFAKTFAPPVLYMGYWIAPEKTTSVVNKIGKRMTAKGQKVSNETLQAIFKAHTRPLQEPATRYLIAAGIAQLLHRNPHDADQILNQSTKNRPLRFIVSQNKPWLVAGQALPGKNIILLNSPAMWKAIEQKNLHVAQHEFVHLLSENNGMNKLGFMNEEQTKDFKAARKALKKQFRTQDLGWLGGLRCILPFKSTQANSTGIRSYGYFNNMEFLTVSLDTFMQAPEELCRTKPGQKLYDIYKELFHLDPINDYAQLNETRQYLPQSSETEIVEPAQATYSTDDNRGSTSKEIVA